MRASFNTQYQYADFFKRDNAIIKPNRGFAVIVCKGFYSNQMERVRNSTITFFGRMSDARLYADKNKEKHVFNVAEILLHKLV